MNGSEPQGCLGGRWPELRALIGWVVHSWLRPAGSAGTWEQNREKDERRHVSFGKDMAQIRCRAIDTLEVEALAGLHAANRLKP